MSGSATLMFQEAASSGNLIFDQRRTNAPVLDAIGNAMANQPPRALLTLARGSSDNAATLARYVIERHVGLITGSLAPSVSSVYRAKVDYSDCLVLAISQSGRSPDIVGTAHRAKEAGATVIALVNDLTSPLAEQADFVLDVCAGPELSVAATKSFALSVSAILDLVGAAARDEKLRALVGELPELLNQAWQLDWSSALKPFGASSNAFVIARGHALGIAQEMALKLKETCAIHAEAISSAEVRHGPMTLVGKEFPVLIIGQDDESLAATTELAQEFLARGATVVHSGLDLADGVALPTASSDPTIAPLLQLQSFYRFCEQLSRSRGLDPDAPAHLNKVTRTL